MPDWNGEKPAFRLRGVAQGGVDRLRAERHVTAVLRSVFVGGQDAVRAGRNEQERTLDLAGSSLFEPVDDEVGVEHVAGCQVAVGAPVVGAYFNERCGDGEVTILPSDGIGG